MKAGKASRTALRVATILVTLNETPDWAGRLPADMPELTERLVLAADIDKYGADMIAESKTEKTIANFARFEKKVPGMFEGLGHRKLFMEAQFAAAMADGIKQVAIIGAGFDTLCLRHAAKHTDVSFIELDHPATQAAKRKGLEEIGLPDNLHLIAADLGKTPLQSVMKEAEDTGHWARSDPALFIVEGLLMYLRPSEVKDLFERIAQCGAAKSRVAFSHLNSLKRYYFAQLIVRLMSEPWRSAADASNLSAYLTEHWSILHTAPGQTDRDLEGFSLAELKQI